MRRLILFLLFTIIPASYSVNSNAVPTRFDISRTDRLYLEMGLEELVDYTAFRQAMAGYSKIPRKKDIVSIIDFTKPSIEERLYVLDIKRKEVLFVSHVSHGRNSGENYATSFSNRSGSYQSSLGFFLTENSYTGSNGYSLRLDGLETGINDQAKARAIVIHGADYCDPKTIAPGGRLGRSLGCPALPKAVNREIIDAIKDGSVLYIYANDNDYLTKSQILKNVNYGTAKIAAAM